MLLRILAVVVTLIAVLGLAVQIAPAQASDPAEKHRTQMNQGNYKDAYDGLSKMVLDPKGTSALHDDFNRCVQALRQLGRTDEQDEFIEKTIAVHKGSWAFLWTAARAYRDIEHYGFIVSGKFNRGSHRGGTAKYVNSFDRDRTRSLQLMQEAMPLMSTDAKASNEQKAQFYYELSKMLIGGSNGPDAWRLQYLSDLAELPDYEEGYGYYYRGRGWGWGYNASRGAPVDDKGQPVFHTVPKSWADAKTDGQRWRWSLIQASEASAGYADMIRWEFATFLREQFDVQTMAQYGQIFRGSDDDSKKDESGPFAVHTLSDDETIAKLANGIKRFKLPAEFNFISLLKTIAEGQSGRSVNAHELLAQLYEDRQQYVTAAEWWKKTIARFGPGHDNYRQRRLEQIVGNWSVFENSLSTPAGENAKLQLRFRNATKINFEAYEVEVEKLLSDVKAYLKANPRKLDWDQVQIDQIGYRLVEKNQRQYIGKQVANWALDLKPREKHFDKRITVETPLKKAGAYLLVGTTEKGNTTRIIVWLADTAIVKKGIDKASYHWFADAVTGQPVAGADVNFFGYEQRWIRDNTYEVKTLEFNEKSDADGQVIADVQRLPTNYSWLITAKTKDGRFAYHGYTGVWYGTWYDRHDANYHQTRVFAITDRPVYRPGDTVKFKLWLGQSQYDKDGPSPFANQTYPIRIHTPKGDVAKNMSLVADEFGGVSGEYQLDKETTLGVYYVAHANFGGVNFRVEEYKKPEFEVSIDAPKDPVMLGEKITATINAKYYFGAPVTSAKVKYKVTRTDHDAQWYPAARWDWYYNPGYWWFAHDYAWYPGWYDWGCRRPYFWWYPRPTAQPEIVTEAEVPVSDDGTIKVEFDTAVAKAAYGDIDHRYEISAEVTDQSRRTITGSGQVLVARKPYKVYAWVNRGHFLANEVIEAQFSAQTLDNKPVKGKGNLRLLALSYKDGKPVETEVQRWALDTNEQGTATQQIRAAQPGQYRLSYTVTDEKNHAIEGGYVFVVRGEKFDGREFRFNDIELVTDKKEYSAGDKVKLMINTNRADAAVLLFIRPSEGVYLAPKVIRLKGKSQVEEIEITKKDMPNFFIEAVTVANARVYQDTREVIVPPEDRVLNVAVSADSKEYKPGQKAKFTVSLTEKNGEPFTGSVVLSLYDKAVEYISGGSNVGDIRKTFWQWRRHHYARQESSLDRVASHISKSHEIMMGYLGVFGAQATEFGEADGQMAAEGFSGGNKALRQESKGGLRGAIAPSTPAATGAPMGLAKAAAADRAGGEMSRDKAEMDRKDGGGGGMPPTAEPMLRSNFADTAAWFPNLVTVKDGKATVEVTMPENLTTWRAKAWAMGNGTRVGQGETDVITTKNLIVRLQAPRFFVQKDEVVLSANVHNYLKTSKEVRVILELDGDTLVPMDRSALEPTVVRIDPKGEKRIDWRVRAVKEGLAVVRMKALTDEESDATQMSFPVYVHGMLKTEPFSGFIAREATQASLTLSVPKERRIADSRLEIRYSPSVSLAMVDALPYLADYPYGCTEQTLNRFVPTVITQKILLEMNLDLAKIRDKRTNLNAQEIGNDVERAKQWKRWQTNPVFDKAEVDKMVREGVTKLTNMQLSDGGWGWFSGWGEQSWPHTTAVVVHGLMTARANDVKIDDNVINRGVAWLNAWQDSRIAHIKKHDGRADNLDALVYMILVNANNDNKVMRELLYRDEDRNGLSVYGKCVFGLALHKVGDKKKLDMILQNVSQYLVQDDENQTAYLKLPNDSYWWYWYGNDIEANAYYLKLLAKTDPKGQTASRLAKYLINNRKHATYWKSTRDTAYCIEAFADYIRASGEDKPDMTITIAFNGKKLKEVKITAEDLFAFDNKLVLTGADIPDGQSKLEITKTGTGPLYFNAYLTNFTLEDRITKAGLEVKINRKFYKLDRVDKTVNAEGMRGQVEKQKVEKYARTELADLSTVKSGQLVEIELEIESKNDYEYIILEDMKAAGFEAVETKSGYNGNDMGAYVEFRDNRVSFFVRSLARGKHSVSYRLRAEVPGAFSALPAKANGMYAPELVGNSDEMKIKVIDADPLPKVQSQPAADIRSPLPLRRVGDKGAR